MHDIGAVDYVQDVFRLESVLLLGKCTGRYIGKGFFRPKPFVHMFQCHNAKCFSSYAIIIII